MAKLHEIDELHLRKRRNLAEGDKCFYFMENIGEGYTVSDANNLISNFKKPIDRRGRPEWHYKEKAIKQFGRDLCGLKLPRRLTIIPAPTSKPRSHSEFDDRIDRAVAMWAECDENAAVELAIDTASAVTAAHQGGSRDVEEIYANTIWNGFSREPSEIVILVDDVLTTGAHFRAWKRFIMEHDNRVKDVYGVFWAIHMWKDQIEDVPLNF